MGITLQALKTIGPHLRGKKILSLSYPDLVVEKHDIVEVLNVEPSQFTTHGAWHGRQHPLPETVHVMGLLGSHIDCVDIVASRGCERIVDLNYPHDFGDYDVVLDCGTTEHCFNVGQAIINAAQAVKPGGVIFHCSPMTAMNHGFWNMNPTLYHDFYSQNGWGCEITGAIGQHPVALPTYKRFRIESEAYVLVLATRPQTKEPMKYPVQQKYLKHPMLGAAA